MNKYIIFLVIILIATIIYFKYKIYESKLERFLEGDVNINTVINKLQNNNLTITDDGGLSVITNTGENLDITLNKNNVINLGTDIKIDPSNNKLQCKNYNVDNTGIVTNSKNNISSDPSGNILIGEFIFSKSGKIINKKNSFLIDPSGNLTFDKFIFNKDGNLTRKDNSFKTDINGNITMNDFIFDTNKKFSKKDNSLKIDSNGNMETKDYIYSTSGKLMKKDNSYQIDPIGAIITPDYTINTKDKRFIKNDNSIEDNPDKMKCNEYEFDRKNISIGNRIKIGQNYYNINNGVLSNDTNTVTLTSNNLINLNSNQYTYDIIKNDLSGNINTHKQFNIPNPLISSQIFLGKNQNVIYNYNGLGSTIYKVSQITFGKPNTINTYDYPLHISSIRFFDHNDNVILPNLYTVSLQGIADGTYNTAGVTSLAKYYSGTSNTNISYGGPKVDSYSLFLNKTISYNSLTLVPQIDLNTQSNITSTNTLYATGQILANSYDLIGHGLCKVAYITGGVVPVTSVANSVAQTYTFTFIQPVFIKYVEIENRKTIFSDTITGMMGITTSYPGFNRIFGAQLDTFLNINDIPTFDPAKNRIKSVRGNTGQTTGSDPIINLPSLTANGLTKTKPKGTIEKYTSVNYNNTTTTFTQNQYDPIVRYYIQ